VRTLDDYVQIDMLVNGDDNEEGESGVGDIL
jgi:hypothetical protein